MSLDGLIDGDGSDAPEVRKPTVIRGNCTHLRVSKRSIART